MLPPFHKKYRATGGKSGENPYFFSFPHHHCVSGHCLLLAEYWFRYYLFIEELMYEILVQSWFFFFFFRGLYNVLLSTVLGMRDVLNSSCLVVSVHQEWMNEASQIAITKRHTPAALATPSDRLSDVQTSNRWTSPPTDAAVLMT